jgi:uncharacterized protein YjeT (DUF2065 family)
METTLFSVIDAEIPVIAPDESAESSSEFVTLDDAKLRQVGGGLVIGVVY